jgi:hypothetical protein
MSAEFLEQLRQAAEAMEREEAEFRRQSRRRLEGLEAARTQLYRRFNFLKDMAAAAALQTEAASGIEALLALATAETGWSAARTGYEEMRERLRPVAAAIQEAAHPAAAAADAAAVPIDVVATFAEFETWHREKFSQDFLDLLGRPAPTFQPLVDF